jgi:L-rhamnonate dehydratase
MLDCYMAWNVEYTLRMARLLEPLCVRLDRRGLPPDDYGSYSDLTARIDSTAIATGAHEYTRWFSRAYCPPVRPHLAA